MNVDPTICCHVHKELNEGSSGRVSETSTSDDLIAWETNIKSFSLRQFPPESNLFDWIALKLGPGNDSRRNQNVGGFWAGRNGAFEEEDRLFGGKKISS